MPIKTLTGRQPQFPEIGQIRKGKKRDPEKPREKLEDLNYFRIEIDPEEPPETSRALIEAFGPKPKTIDVMLPFPTVEQNWKTWREAYLAGGLIHRCDGETVEYEIDNKNGQKIVVEGLTADGKKKFCDGRKPVGTYFSEAKNQDVAFYCKPVGRLKVIIPQLYRAVFFTVLTSSQWDVIHIDEQLNALFLLAGKVSGIPLKLQRRMRMVSCPQPDGKRIKREKSLISIEADPEWTKRMLMRLKAASLPGNGMITETPALEAPESEPASHFSEDDEEETLTSPAGSGDFGSGIEPEEDDGKLEERKEIEIPFPPRLTADFYYTFAKKVGLFSEAQSIMKENRLDLRKSWIGLLRSHVPAEEWPKFAS